MNIINNGKVMSSITINGNSFEGKSIVIRNNRVIINGNDVTPDEKVINISVKGDLDNITSDYCNEIVITGSVNTVKSTSGDIECGNVTGNIETTSGDIECGNVGGNIKTISGDVKCDEVKGSVNTLSGDIKNKK